ncbi:MAG TPA: OmpA family protein [Thermoanaerobaculia bacterium]|nr:OmpA family protein [Thermoanaerobaculia bacterium]
MLRLNHRLLFPVLCFLIAGSAFAQGLTLTRDEQLMQVAPSVSGQIGLFETVTADTLRQGELSFGIYFNNYDLLAGPAPDFAPPSQREYQDMSYDLYRFSASVGYGLTDRWDISLMLPYDRIVQNGGDRAGWINGWLYNEGAFTDSGLGNLHLATKFGVTPADAPSRFALSLFTELPTGDDDGGITTGSGAFGVGAHWTRGIGTLSASYTARGDREDEAAGVDSGIPNELRIDGGLNVPLRFWPTTNWISEVNGIIYTGGDNRPDSPIFLVTGLRHWFGSSGWALSAGARWNVAKFLDNNDECRITELDDCALSGLIGLTFAPMRFAALPPPPPPPPAPLPPVVVPVPPPAPPPITPPRVPQVIRTDEIHFEPGSARLTNIAKAILDDVALRMRQEPTSTALVIGYTDNRENTGPNADLDRRRAEAVRDYLVSRHNIDPARITVEGRNARDPIGDNATADGRARNRRVVIRLTLP